MLRKLQARLTYANVMSTIAVFGVLAGGVAWALDRNGVKSRHIAPGQVKLSDTNDRLRLKCRAGTRYHEGACIEPLARQNTNNWNDAAADCRDEGRRLPTMAELSTFRLEPGVTIGAGGSQEWVLQHDEDSANAWTVTGAGTYVVSIASNDLPYRCVARPKR